VPSENVQVAEFEEVNDRVLLLGHCVGRMSGSGLEVDTPVAAVYDIEQGRVVRLRHFLDQDQARAEAGLD
jgi:ketosteroid isomerase-like protein